MALWSIPLAAAAAFVAGSAYYMVFMRQWHAYTGIDAKKHKKSFRKTTYLWWFLTLLVAGCGMWLVMPIHEYGWIGALAGGLVGLVIAVTMVLTASIGYLVWETRDAKRWKLLLLNSGFSILALTLMGAVIGAF